MKNFSGILILLLFIAFSELSAQVKEPYKLVHNGSYTGIAVKESPDPLITYWWKNPSNRFPGNIYVEAQKINLFSEKFV